MRPRCQWDSAASEDCPRLQRTVPSSEEPPVFRRPSRRQRPVPRLASQLLWRGWFSTFDGGQTDPRGEAAVMLSSLRSAVRPGQSRVSAYLRLKVGTRSWSLGPTHQNIRSARSTTRARRHCSRTRPAGAPPCRTLRGWRSATTRERSRATAGPGRSFLGRLKSAVTIPCRCEPGIHRTYAELAAR